MGFQAGSEIPITRGSLFKSRGLIAGEWRKGQDGKTFDVIEPSSGNVLGQCADLGLDDCLEAIESAEHGFRTFSKSTTAKERRAILRRWYDLIMQNFEDCKSFIISTIVGLR